MKNVLAFLVFSLSAGVANAGEYLSGDEIKSLFSNKTFDIYTVKKGKNLSAYDSPDGEHVVHIPWKGKISHRKWWVEENKHCTSHPKRADRCKDMKSIGEGKYEGYHNGDHVVTLSNFRDGNHID